MSTARIAVKNISYVLAARLVFRILTAIALIAAARYLGDDRWGTFTTAAAWANAFLALNDIGMSTLMLRAAARTPEKINAYFGNTLLVEFVLSAVIWVALLVIGSSLYDRTTTLLMLILGASNLIYEFRKVMRGVFRSQMNLQPIAITELFNGAVFCILTFTILGTVHNRDIGMFSIAHAGLWTDVVSVILLFILTIRIVRPKIDTGSLRSMIKEALPFSVYNLFYMIYFQVDQIILSIMMNKTAVGVYSAPAQLVTVLLFIPIMVFQVTTPMMYRFHADDRGKYKRAHSVLWRYLSAFGIPAGVGMAVLAPQILALVYGRDFYNDPSNFDVSTTTLVIFGAFLAVRFAGIGHGNALTTSDKQKLRATLQTISVFANIVLDIILIARWGVLGAAIATLITECFIAMTAFYLTAKELRETAVEIGRGLLPILAASAGMGVVLSLIKKDVSVIVLVFCGIAIYGALLWLFRFFKPVDRTLLSDIFRKKSINSHSS